MAKRKGDVDARLGEAETILKAMRLAMRNPNVSESESEFRSKLVSFLALARSCVTMSGMKAPKVDEVINNWNSPGKKSLFLWLRITRDGTLKEGVPVLMVRTEEVSIAEYSRRFPSQAGTHQGRGVSHSPRPASRPTTFIVPVFELEVDGKRVPAIDACRSCLRVVRRFIADAKVRGFYV